MAYSTQLKLLIAAVLAFALLGRVGFYFFNKHSDLDRRPWAYTDDPRKPLLVGKWRGAVTDPDGVIHQVELEIEEPLSDAERQKRFSQRRIRRDRSSPTFFDGTATLETRGRKEPCEIWGGLDKPDGNQVHLQFRPLDDKHPPGFNINLAKGRWQENTLELDVSFAFFKNDGASFSDSADPRFDQQGKLLLSRALP